MPGISAQEITRRCRLLETGQRTVYAVGDDGDHEAGEGKVYYVLAAGAYAGTSNIEVAHYAAATISFTAPNTIACAANGLVGWAVNDVMVIKGTANNDGVVTVTGIGGAPANLTISAAVNEAAGAYMSLYKRAAHSNNAVFDRRTGRMWSRYTSNGEAVGVLSNGTLNWYDVATRFTIYAAANTVSVIMPGNILRIIGGAALTQFHVGDLLMCAGFANAVNNLSMMYVVSVTVNGADLDVVIDPGNQVLIAEGAVGDTIYLNCRSIFNYAAGANLIGLGGYTDWRGPDDTELLTLRNMEVANALPDAAAFPGWPLDFIWSSTTAPSLVTGAMTVRYSVPDLSRVAKTTTYLTALIRG